MSEDAVEEKNETEDGVCNNDFTRNLAKIFFAFATVYLLLIISQFYWAGVALINETPDSTNHIATAAIIGFLPVTFILAGFYMNGYSIVNVRSGGLGAAKVALWVLLMFVSFLLVVESLWIYQHILSGAEIDGEEGWSIGPVLEAIQIGLPVAVIAWLFYNHNGGFPVPSDWRLGALTGVPFFLSHVQYMLIWPWQEGFIEDGAPLEGVGSWGSLHALNGIIILLFSIEIFRRTMPKALGEDYAFGFQSSKDGEYGQYTRYLYFIPMGLMVFFFTMMMLGPPE